jgi:hypothetical protein
MGNVFVAVVVALIGLPLLMVIARLAAELDLNMGATEWSIVGVFGAFWVGILFFLLTG